MSRRVSKKLLMMVARGRKMVPWGLSGRDPSAKTSSPKVPIKFNILADRVAHLSNSTSV